MSSPEFKIQVPLDDSRITSTVPGEQKLREIATESIKASEGPSEDVVFNIAQDSHISTEAHHPELKEHEEIKRAHEKAEIVTEDSKEDFVLSPVITVTKEEAALTKGDLKLQRVSVSEDISGTKTTASKEEVSVVKNGEPEIRTRVLSVQQIRTQRKNEVKEQTETKKPKTRIPTLRFRQAVDQLKQDRKSFEDNKGSEAPSPLPSSAIPRLKDIRSPAPSIPTPQKETMDTLPRLSDEFDKLYNEIGEDQDSLDNLSISSRIEDPVKLDNTFEEIIHAYEENNIQPIKVEKVRQSKIPLLKRKSEQEIEVPKQSEPVFKQSVSVDFSKIKSSETITENHSKIQSVTLNKSPIRTSVISKRISEIKSEQESSAGYFETISTVNIATIENNKTGPNILHKKIENEVLNKPTDVTDAAVQNISTIENNSTGPNIFNKKVENEELNKSTDVTDAAVQKVNATEETSTITMPVLEHINKKNELNLNVDTNKSIPSKTESVMKIEEHKMITQKKENGISEVSSTNTTTEKLYNDSSKKINKNKFLERSFNSDVVTENKNEEDIPILRGKVNRIIHRMNSKEVDLKQSKIDLGDEKPNEKSVLSKIAIFEHPNHIGDNGATKNLCNAQTKIIKPIEPIDAKNDSSDDKPKIVDNLLKALPTRDNEKNDGKGNKNDINNMKTIDSNNNDPITKVDPKVNESASHNKLIDIQFSIDPESNVHIKPLEINTDNLKPSQVENEESSTPAIYNKQGEVEDNHSASLNNINSRKHDTQETVSKGAINKIVSPSKSERDVIQDKQYRKTFYKQFSANEPITTNGTHEITSDIIKQEVKFECIKIDDEIKIKENKEIIQERTRKDEGQLRIHSYRNNETDKIVKSSSLADIDLGGAVKGRVQNMIVRMKSLEKLDAGKKEIIDIRERPRKKSVLEKIALFENKVTPVKSNKDQSPKIQPKTVPQKSGLSEEEYTKKIEELSLAKTKYGVFDQGKMKYIELRDGGKMPAIGIGTALIDPKLTRYVVQAAIDLGYRTIDTAYIYGNEKEVGKAIKEKIRDGTVTRSDLFIISKLWSTFHRQDLVERACRASLDAMGLDYFDLYLIHNPMSFKEGGDPIPKIASVIQFSAHDYLDAWFGVEGLVRKGLVRRGGVSNFNSLQVDRVVDKGKIKPVINQVECHPYLSQQRLDDFCQARNVKLCCFGVLGSKGTPQELKSALPPAIDDPLVRVMAAGLDVSPAALLVSYQLAQDRGVIVKASSGAHLWANLQALFLAPSAADVSALHALNRNKRNFTFKGMGDTHRNYPFNIPY